GRLAAPRRDRSFAAKMRHEGAQLLDREDFETRNHAGLRRRFGGHDQGREACTPGTVRDDERAGGRPQVALEAQLAPEHHAFETLARDDLMAGEQRTRDREIEPRTVFAAIGGSEVHHLPPRTNLVSAVRERAPNPLSTLTDRPGGSPDDGQTRDRKSVV